MLTALGLSALFLVSYVVYHTFSEHTRYGGEGTLRYVYFVILASHIFLAIFALPLALFSAFRGLQGDYAKHKRIVRWTFPVWLYVSVTGVIVYLMISPYYTH
jgi:putative membrane protein